MRESVPTARYSPVCNVLRQWKTSLILTYRVYRLYDIYFFKYFFEFLFLPRTSIDSPHNCQVMQTLIKEVTGLNPSFESSDVRGTTNIILRHYVVIKLHLSIIICRGCI